MGQSETGFASSDKNAPIKVLALDSFEPAFPTLEAQAEETQRRFITYLLPPLRQSAIDAGTTRIAYNTAQERFTLKSPLFCAEERRQAAAWHNAASEPAFPIVRNLALETRPSMPYKLIEAAQAANKTRATLATQQSKAEAQRMQLLAEYRCALAVSQVKGFPRVYGLGYLGSEPVIISERIVGPTLAEALDSLPHNPHGTGLQPQIAAAITLGVLQALIRARCLKGKFLHRDISPQNIIIRTSERTLHEQIETVNFDICLIDFGSSIYLEPENNAAMLKQDLYNTPQGTSLWRYGTPEYAAPEMLIGFNDADRSIDELVKLRTSETIDTYALCSVLYQMLTFATPYSLANRTDIDPYLIKSNEQPNTQPLKNEGAASPKAELLEIALKDIAPKQENRHTLTALYKALRNWQAKHHLQLGITYPPPADLEFLS